MSTEQVTKQEVFSKVWERSKIKARAVAEGSSNGACLYRGVSELDQKTPLPCFAGALITDAEYSDAMEYNSFADLISKRDYEPYGTPEYGQLKWPALQRFFGVSRFVQALQQIHDNSAVEEWEDQLRLLADSEDLQVPE
jgi:hypothetical protein